MTMPVPFPEDSYHTPENSAAGFASVFPTLSFFFRILNIVRRDGNLAEQGLYDGDAWVRGSIESLHVLESCGVRIHVEGMNNMLKGKGPFVFIGNHMSTLETFILPCLIQPRMPVTFVVKDALLKYPWFGPVLKTRNPISVTRVNPREDLAAVMEGGVDRLRNGCSVIVFPQSTRSLTLDTSLFNSIGVKLARKAGVPVIPVALRTDAWGMGRFIKDLGPVNPQLPVHFAFGEPMEITGNGKAEHEQICRFIGEHLEKWNLPVPT